jgi:hypothetical protein
MSSSSGSGNNISQKMKLRLKRELKRATTTNNSKFVEHTKKCPTSPIDNAAAWKWKWKWIWILILQKKKDDKYYLLL